MTESATARYAMGYDDRERRRLQLQASIINPVTDQLLTRAGLGAGMRVLDVGSGVGDVAILAADAGSTTSEIVGRCTVSSIWRSVGRPRWAASLKAARGGR